MSVRTTPETGDIVVRQEKRDGTVVYVMHTAPGPDQYVLGSRDEAVAQTVTFAKRERVRVWFTKSPAKQAEVSRWLEQG